MSYTKPMFSADLRSFLEQGVVDHAKIADWAYATHLAHVRDVDADVDRWLIELGAMSMGEEFELTLDELRNMVAVAGA